MSLLNDAELVKQLRGQHPIVRDFPTKVAKEFQRDPLGPKSPAQPSSIDLHIGQIYLPGASQGKAVPHKEWQLSPGHSLIVVTMRAGYSPERLRGSLSTSGSRPTGVIDDESRPY